LKLTKQQTNNFVLERNSIHTQIKPMQNIKEHVGAGVESEINVNRIALYNMNEKRYTRAENQMQTTST
jgi:hypothetical protein